MRYKALMVTASAAGALLWCTSTSDRAEQGDPAGSQHSIAPPAPEDPASIPAAGTARLPASAATSKPSLADERLDFDRRPWNPNEELDTVYERRAIVFKAFDRFVEETGISDRKAQQLMMILYDYQENMRLIHESIMEGSEHLNKWQFEMRLRAASVVRYTTGLEIRDRVEEVLSPEEMRAWRRMVLASDIWLKIAGQPMIAPVSSR